MDISIRKNIENQLSGKTPEYKKEKSFDLCFNYFNENRRSIDIDMGCLHLWAFLASWGMLRGSSKLFKYHNFTSLEGIIKYAKTCGDFYWDIDITRCTAEEAVSVLNQKEHIKSLLREINVSPTETLITKIMLGIFCNIPAIDKYFGRTIKHATFDKKALDQIQRVYQNNRKDIDELAEKYGYKKIKIIDMYGFEKGKIMV